MIVVTDGTKTPTEVVDAMHAAFRRGDLAAIAAHSRELGTRHLTVKSSAPDRTERQKTA
jgi:hypothetical protein